MPVLIDLAAATVGTAVLAWLASVLLGVSPSLLRSALVGLFGLAAGSIVALNLSSGQHGLASQAPVAVAAQVVAAMLAMTALEILSPSHVREVSRSRPSLPHPLQAVTRRAARGRRYAQILLTFSRHGVVAQLRNGGDNQKLARSLRLALEDSGGVFVKLGQFLSTRPDILPAAVVSEMSVLQDGAPPVPIEQILRVIREDLGAAADPLLDGLDPAPVAAASIAQVHRATFANGDTVMVKVQRPEVHASVARDLDILRVLARRFHRRSRWARGFRLVELVEGFARSLHEELDFRVEARNTETLRSGSCGPECGVVIPAVRGEFVTRRVLVTDWLDGSKLRNLQVSGHIPGLDRPALARDLLGAVVGQLVVMGTFHADPHPGNVLVLSDGRLGLIDFGSVGRLDNLEIEALQATLHALRSRDSQLMCEALLAITTSDGEVKEEHLERALARFIAERLEPGAWFDFDFFSDLFGVIRRFNLAFPPEIAAVCRCLVLLESTLRVLDPRFSITTELIRMGQPWRGHTPAQSSVGGSISEDLELALLKLRALPRRLEHIASSLDRGQLVVNTRFQIAAEERRLVERLVERLALVVFGPAVGVVLVLLLGTHVGPTLGPSVPLNEALGYGGICLSIALILRAAVGVGWSRSG